MLFLLFRIQAMKVYLLLKNVLLMRYSLDREKSDTKTIYFMTLSTNQKNFFTVFVKLRPTKVKLFTIKILSLDLTSVLNVLIINAMEFEIKIIICITYCRAYFFGYPTFLQTKYGWGILLRTIDSLNI